MSTYTFVTDWTGSKGFFYPPVVVAEGETMWHAQDVANGFASTVLKEHFEDIEDLFETDGYVVAVFDGDVTEALVSDHSVIKATTGEVVINL